MCRYAMYGPYKGHYACFNCRKSFRYSMDDESQFISSKKNRYRPQFAQPVKREERESFCPQCRSSLHSMGLDFKAPKQKDKEHWKVVEILYGHGFAYHSCGCSGPGYRPSKLREVPAFLAKRGIVYKK